MRSPTENEVIATGLAETRAEAIKELMRFVEKYSDIEVSRSADGRFEACMIMPLAERNITLKGQCNA